MSACGLAAVLLRSEKPLPPTPIAAIRSRLLAPSTRLKAEAERVAPVAAMNERRVAVRWRSMTGFPGGEKDE